MTRSHRAFCSRREFVRGLAALGLVPLTGPSLAAAGKSSYQLGCYTRPWDQYEYRVALDGIAEAGFKYAGLMTAKSKSWVLITVESAPDEVAAIAGEVKQRGLKVLSLYAGEFPVQPSIDVGIAGLKKLIDHAVLCACPQLMLAGTTNDALVEPYLKCVTECCDYAAAKGVGLSIKPHGGPNSTGPQCRKLIERVGHRNFKLWYDPGNIFYYSDGKLDPAQDSATVDGLVAGVSVKDFRPPKEVMVTPGDGLVNFNEVFANLRKGGFARGPVLIECLARGESPAGITAEATRARKFLQSLL